MSPQIPIRCVGLLLVSALAGTVTGCRTLTTLELESRGPIAADLPAVGRLAVIELKGSDVVRSHCREELARSLAESRLYAVIDPALVDAAVGRLGPPAIPADRIGEAVGLGRELQADSVLIGQVRAGVDWGSENGAATIRIGDPTAHVRLSVSLIDVRSGRILWHYDAATTFRGPISRVKPGIERPDEVLKRLASEAVEEVTGQLLPSREAVSVSLAADSRGGATYLGDQAAARGDWDAAVRQWTAAIDATDPRADLQFRLGLAREARGDWHGAYEDYAAALRMEPAHAASQEGVDRLARTWARRGQLEQQLARRHSLQTAPAGAPMRPEPHSAVAGHPLP